MSLAGYPTIASSVQTLVWETQPKTSRLLSIVRTIKLNDQVFDGLSLKLSLKLQG
jgi:hypothetical protein